MTNPNKTAIAVVLDRSGSMQACRNDTIGGFNTFVEEQRKLPGYATLSLIQFDDVYQEDYLDKLLVDVPNLTSETYVPRGYTALHDAIGRTIVNLGAKLAKLPEAERPGKVVMVIITDGQENASKEYNAAKVKELIEHQRTKYQWEFVYLGANQDAVTVGSIMGIAKGSSASYSVDNTKHLFQAMAANVSSYRSAQGPDAGAVLAFSAVQRDTLVQPQQ